jgi:hypothetical protein
MTDTVYCCISTWVQCHLCCLVPVLQKQFIESIETPIFKRPYLTRKWTAKLFVSSLKLIYIILIYLANSKASHLKFCTRKLFIIGLSRKRKGSLASVISLKGKGHSSCHSNAKISSPFPNLLCFLLSCVCLQESWDMYCCFHFFHIGWKSGKLKKVVLRSQITRNFKTILH